MVGETVIAKYLWFLPPRVVEIVAAFLLSLSLTFLICSYMGSPTMGVQVWTGKALICLSIVGILVVGGIASGLPGNKTFLFVCLRKMTVEILTTDNASKYWCNKDDVEYL